MKDQMKKTVYALFPFIGLAAVFIIFFVLILIFKDSEKAMNFIGLENIRSMITTTVIVGIGALGMTLVIISGGIDLSVGSMLALGSVALAVVMSSNTSVYVKDRSADQRFLLQEVMQSQNEESIKTLMESLQLPAEATMADAFEKLSSNTRDIPNKFRNAESCELF